MIEKLKNLLSEIKYKTEYKLPTAEEAYYKTKYGFFSTAQERIRLHQNNIRTLIENKMNRQYKDDSLYNSYYCVYDFDEDMNEYIEEVLKPFKENGYQIININDKVDFSRKIFLITWDKKF